MDGRDFIADYAPDGEVYTTAKHSVNIMSHRNNDFDRLAVFYTSYGLFDEVNKNRLRKRANSYIECNYQGTEVQAGLLSQYLARLAQHYTDDDNQALYMGVQYGTTTLYDVIVDRNQRYEKFSEEEVWRVLAALCDAARFMHSEEKPDTELEEIPHLNICPKNIFLHNDGARVRLGFPYICPATSFKDPENYATFHPLGEAHFAAPEFLEVDSQGNCACDIFSIGMIGYAMMVGATPSSATDLISLQTELLNSGAVYLPPGLPYTSALIDLVNSMLTFDPSSRPVATHLCAHPQIAQCIEENGAVPVTAASPPMTRDIVAPGSGLSNGMTEFMTAAKRGDLDGVRTHMHQAGNLDKHGRTGLMYAAEHGHTACVEAILVNELGRIEVGKQDKYMWSATMYAAQNGHRDCVVLLKDEYGLRRKDGATALFTAVFWNRVECVEVLAPIEARIATNDRYWQGEAYTAAMEAARWGRPECLAVILRYVDSATTDRSGNNVDYYARNPWEHVSAEKSARVRQVLEQ